MNKSFIAVSRILEKKDWTSLRKFVLMYSGEGSDLVALFDYAKSHADELDSVELHAEYFSSLSKKGFQNLGSRLFSISEEWLVYRQSNIDVEQKELLLNKFYNDHGLYRLADQKAKSLDKKWTSSKKFGIQKYQRRVQLLHQQCYSDNPVKYEKNSTLLSDLAGSYMTGQKLQGLLYEAELHNWGTIKQIDYTSHIATLQEVTKLLPSSELTEILDDLVNLVSNLDLASFLRIKDVLMADQFESHSELHQITTHYTISFCIKLWQKGVFTDADESARIIEYGLSSGIMLKSGKIPVIRFYNLLATLGALKSHEWNQDFIARWKDSVETQSIESTAALANALNAFIFEKYELIIPLLRGLEFQDYAERMRAMGVELIGWYVDRKENYAFLRNFLGNYKRTLSRNSDRTSDYFVKSHVNLTKVIELLVQRDFRKVTINLDKYDSLIYRKWLQGQIDEKAS